MVIGFILEANDKITSFVVYEWEYYMNSAWVYEQCLHIKHIINKLYYTHTQPTLMDTHNTQSVCFYNHHCPLPCMVALSWAGQGLVPWGQLISSPAWCVLYLDLWIATTDSYCCTTTVRKALEVLEVWKWLIYLEKSHFPLRRKACVLPLDFKKVCRCLCVFSVSVHQGQLLSIWTTEQPQLMKSHFNAIEL